MTLTDDQAAVDFIADPDGPGALLRLDLPSAHHRGCRQVITLPVGPQAARALHQQIERLIGDGEA